MSTLKDLLLQPDAALDLNAPAFGAQVKGDVLFLPEALYALAKDYNCTGAASVIAYLRQVHESMAEDLRLTDEQTRQKTQELVASLTGHVAAQLLAEPEPLNAGFGAYLEGYTEANQGPQPGSHRARTGGYGMRDEDWAPGPELPNHLDIKADPTLDVKAPAFGAVVSEDGQSLHVPQIVADYLASRFVFNAPGFLAYARTLPDDMAHSWGLDPADMDKKTEQELVAILTPHLEPRLIKRPEPLNVGFGAWVDDTGPASIGGDEGNTGDTEKNKWRDRQRHRQPPRQLP